MKTLEKRNLTIEIPGLKQPNTLYLIGECLNQVPEKGYSYDDLKNRQRIDAALKEAKPKSIEFEDNDASNLQTIVKAMRWATRHEDILQFCDDVENMK